jgi:hypothetical protein
MTNLIPQSNSALSIKSMDDLTKLSSMLAASNYFADSKDAAQCGVKILAGLEMGMGAIASMAGVHIIQGKPVVGANLMAAAVKKSLKYNYKIVQHTVEICSIDFYESGELIGNSSFTLDDAKVAGLAGKDIWKKFAKNLLFSRAISNGVRWHCPDIFLGISAYTAEELGHDIDGEGNPIVKVQAMPVQSQLPATKSKRDMLMAQIKQEADIRAITVEMPLLISEWFPGKKGSKELSEVELDELLQKVLEIPMPQAG